MQHFPTQLSLVCHCAAQATPALGNLPTPTDWVHYHFPCVGLFRERAVLSY